MSSPILIGQPKNKTKNLLPRRAAFPDYHYSPKKQKDSLELEVSGLAVQRIRQNSEKWWVL